MASRRPRAHFSPTEAVDFIFEDGSEDERDVEHFEEDSEDEDRHVGVLEDIPDESVSTEERGGDEIESEPEHFGGFVCELCMKCVIFRSI